MDNTSSVMPNVVNECRQLVADFATPKHLVSHNQGAFLDRVLEKVDIYAKDTALS